MSESISILGRTIWFRRGFLFTGGVLVALVLGLSWLGFPAFLTRWILANANSGDYFIEAHDVRLDLRGGVRARDVAVYRKGVVGPPFLQSRELRVLFRLADRPRAGVSRIKEVRASGGVIRQDGGPGFRPWVEPVAAGAAPAGIPGGARKVLPEMELQVVLSDFDVVGVAVEHLQGDLRVDHEGVRLSRLSGRVGRDLQQGSLEGMAAWMSDSHAAGRLITSFDPRALLPACKVFCPDAVAILERFSFASAPPRFELSFEAGRAPAPGLRIKGRMQAAHYAYRGTGIGFANISGEYQVGNGTNRLRLAPFLLVVGGRNAEGWAQYDFSAGTAEYEMTSAIDLASVLRLAGLREQSLQDWDLEAGARVMARGIVNYNDPAKTVVDASVEGTRIGFAHVIADDFRAQYSGRGLTNQFRDIQGKIGNGSFSGTLDVVPDASGSNRNARAKAEIIHVDTDEVLKLLTTNRAWRMDGKLYGHVELMREGATGGDEAFSGSVQLTLRNGRLFRLPLFSGFMDELRRIVPELDFPNNVVDAHISGVIAGGGVESREIRIDDGPVKVVARGRCGLDGTVDYQVTVQLLKKNGFLADTIMGLFSPEKGVEFRLGGSLAKPKWTYVGRR